MSNTADKKANGGHAVPVPKQFSVHMVDDEKSPNKSGPTTPNKVQEEVKEHEDLASPATPSKAGFKSKFFKKKDKTTDKGKASKADEKSPALKKDSKSKIDANYIMAAHF